MNRWIQRISLVAILLNVAALVFHYYAVHKITDRTALHPGKVIRPVTGLDEQRFPEAGSGATITSCHVVRYTSIHCPWCRKDQHSWGNFEQGMLSHGCDSFILAPSASDLPRDTVAVPGRRLLPLVPAYVAQDLNLVATPTTIVLDHSWKVTWSGIGVLQPGDLERALSSLPRPLL